MKLKLLTIVLISSLFGCSSNKTATSTNVNSEEMKNLFDHYWEARMKLFPIEATSNGDNRYNNLLNDDISNEFRKGQLKFYQDYLDSISHYDRNALNNNDRISYDIFKREMEMSIEGLSYNDNLIPFQQFWGLPLSFGQMGSGEGIQPFKTVADYDNFLERIKGFSQWSRTAIENMKAGTEKQIVLPKLLVLKMIPQMEALVVTSPEKSLFYGPITRMPKDFSAADKKRLTEAYSKAIMEEIVPSYKNLGLFLKIDYLPYARATSGISGIPNGKKYYEYLIRYWTTTNLTSDEIFKTGEEEVARIHEEMNKIRVETNFKGELPAFFEFLKTDRQFYPYQTATEVLDAYRAIQKRIDPNLKKMFGRVPKSPFEIRQTEAFRAASASAEYQQGSADGSRPGIFYVPIVNAKEFNTNSGMESLFLHEAIPGHHYQISLQQENESIPKFRRFSWYGSYGEGWALYTESLGKELGLYTDPYQHMAALNDEIHRAIRLVVDVGIHAKGWSREQAIKYMMDNEASSEAGVIAEIERYMAIPGQALSYKIGAIKIRQLRAKYEKQLGVKFKLADFHDELLKDGCMPLDVLEKKMDDWANNQSK